MTTKTSDESVTTKLTMVVTINGTKTNHWSAMGLKHNPFPQLGIKEFDAAEMQINSLDGEPVRNAKDIARRLRGFSKEFIDGCIERWQPGERVSFVITFPRERS
jgi:hypothetical protein